MYTILTDVDPRECIPRKLDKNITEIIERDEEIEIKTIFTGNKSMFLNRTATRIFNLINSSNTLGDIVDKLKEFYSVDAELLYSDTINYIASLWKRGIISWVNYNPLIKTIKKDDIIHIMECPVDVCESNYFSNDNLLYVSPNLKKKQINIRWITAGLINKALSGHLISNNEKTSIVITNQSEGTINLIAVLSDVHNLKIYFNEISMNQTVIANAQSTDNITKKWLCDNGFRSAGTLVNEIKSGNVDLFYKQYSSEVSNQSDI